MDTNHKSLSVRAEETLDPHDWEVVAQLGHDTIDLAIDYLRHIRDRPAWREMPEEVRSRFRGGLPQEPQPLEAVLQRVTEDVMAYPMGNVHPRFWAWYMGSGNMTGALADFMAAVQGSNLGGGNHAAALVDRQVIDWCKEIVGFPASASGTLTSGGSVANLIGLTVARNVKAGMDIREHGVAALPKKLRFYGSDQIHNCHRKAVETLGIGNAALRRVETDADFRIDIAALRMAIAEDRAAGFLPACIIGNAGAVNTGAIDDLAMLADVAAEEDMWFHVDGCIGALIAIAPRNRALVAGLERADSLALDPHKWLHAPFDVGCCLVRDAGAHHAAFATQPEYLASAPRGIASGEWLYELGLQTSRSFRALKVWMALQEHGAEKFGRLIDQNIDQARTLARMISKTPQLCLMAPTIINIVCFRFDPGGLDEDGLKALNTKIMLQLQEDGVAVLSDTALHGKHCLRAAICNHRTRHDDLELLVTEIVRRGGTLLETRVKLEDLP